VSIILKSYANIEFRFVVAVYSEALPIIEYYNLKLINYNHCVNKIYKNKNNNIWLILSGIGNKKAEKAVNSLYEISNLNHNALWINIGIAGHATFNPGQLYEIKKVIYIKNDKNFYYSNSLLNCFEMHECCSVDIQEKAFKDNYIYEMESYGFIKTVEKNCLREHICILKIISDNAKSKPASYKSFAYKYIKKNIEIINKGLVNYAKEIKKNNLDYSGVMDVLNQKYHITFYNNKKIQNLIPKLMIIMGYNSIINEIGHSKSLKALINSFEEKLKSYILKI